MTCASEVRLLDPSKWSGAAFDGRWSCSPSTIRVANDTEYGLSGAVRTGSLERGMHIAEQVRSGMFHINDQTVNDQAGAPFGGMGASGNGSRFGRPVNHDEFTEWRWLTVGSGQTAYPF